MKPVNILSRTSEYYGNNEPTNLGLHISGIYNGINQVLSKKNNSDNEPTEITNILKINHPKNKELYDFVISSEENTEWYMKNKQHIELVDGGIKILGDNICIENEKADDSEGIINKNGKTYFDYESCILHAKSEGKKIIDNWSKYTNFLPGNDNNKVSFLKKVLGLDSNGKYDFNKGEFISENTSGFYHSASGDSLFFTENNLFPEMIVNKSVGFGLRCLKN